MYHFAAKVRKDMRICKLLAGNIRADICVALQILSFGRRKMQCVANYLNWINFKFPGPTSLLQRARSMVGVVVLLLDGNEMTFSLL